MNRFSQPLTTEKYSKFFHLQAIEEQNRLNQHSLVSAFIATYLNEYDTLPDVETVSESLYHINLDSDIIQDELNFYHSMKEI